MPQLSELLDEAVGDQPVRFSTLDVRRRSRQLGVRRRARRVLSGATAVAISVGAAVTISDWVDRGPSRRLPTVATRAATSTATLPTSTSLPLEGVLYVFASILQATGYLILLTRCFKVASVGRPADRRFDVTDGLLGLVLRLVRDTHMDHLSTRIRVLATRGPVR